jgi:hypothetical protein
MVYEGDCVGAVGYVQVCKAWVCQCDDVVAIMRVQAGHSNCVDADECGGYMSAIER